MNSCPQGQVSLNEAKNTLQWRGSSWLLTNGTSSLCFPAVKCGHYMNQGITTAEEETPRNPKVLEFIFFNKEKKIFTLFSDGQIFLSLLSVAMSWFLTVLQQKAAFLVKVRHKALSKKIIYLTFPAFLSIVLSLSSNPSLSSYFCYSPQFSEMKPSLSHPTDACSISH